ASVERAVGAAFGIGDVGAGERRAVVGCSDDERIFGDAEFFELVENYAGGPVEFFDGVAPRTVFAFAAELRTGERFGGAAGHGLGDVEVEGGVLVLFDPVGGGFGVALGQAVAVDGGFDDFVVDHQGKGRPVGTVLRPLA